MVSRRKLSVIFYDAYRIKPRLGGLIFLYTGESLVVSLWGKWNTIDKRIGLNDIFVLRLLQEANGRTKFAILDA